MIMRRLLELSCALVLGALITRGALADAPAVSITYPSSGATIDESLTPAMLLQATAGDPDEAILAVTFFVCAIPCNAPTNVGYVTAPPFQLSWTPSRVLSQSAMTLPYQVWAQAQNVLGLARNSTTVQFTLLQPPPPPSVTLVAPNGAGGETGFVTPTSPVLYATAAAGSTVPPSTIAGVDFLDGGTVIGTVTAPNAIPGGYAFIWQNAPQGMHLIAARSTDSLGYSATSNPVTVYIVGPDPAPQVALTSPVTGQIFPPTSSVPLAAAATSALGNIQRVEFATGNIVIDTSLSPPYTASWLNPPPGNFAIVARAYDDIGVAATSPAAYIQVLPGARAPSVVLTAPAPGATVPSGTPLPLAATALAPDGAIGRVDFYAGITLVGSTPAAPYEFTWMNPSAGPQSLSAKAYDLQGNTGTSAPVAVTVIDNRPPTVTLTSPAAGAQFSAPATIALAANASDLDGTVAKVDFFSGAAKVASAAAEPYSASWNGVGAGTYALTAVATDNLGATATSAAVTVTVTALQSTVAVTAPAGGARYALGQAIVITAQANAPQRSISRVEFYSDANLIGSAPVSGGPSAISVDFSWAGATVGSHALAAKVTTTDGASTTSAPIDVVVSDLAVTLIEPTSGQSYPSLGSVRIAANATETNGTIMRVDFYGDGALLGSSGQLPFAFIWPNLPDGPHTVSAVAVDASGLSASSPVVPVLVQPIAITVDSPSAPPGLSASVASDFVMVRGTYTGPSNTGVTVNGEVAETDGAGHFAMNGVPLVAGDNTIVAQMTTIDGASTSRTMSVTSNGTAPFWIGALPNTGLAPLTTTVVATSRGVGPVRAVELSDLNGAAWDASSFDGQTLGTLTFSTPGIYVPQVAVTYGTGLTHVQTLAIVVRDGAAMDRMFTDMFNRFTSALTARDSANALKYLTEPNRAKYGAAFASLDARLPKIVETFKAFGGVSISDDIAEYALRRDVNGKVKIYLLDFLRDGDGVWRFDSM